MKAYENKKTIICGRTFDEVFCEITNMFSKLNNGWDIASAYSKLYSIASVANIDHCAHECFLSILQRNDWNVICCEEDFLELLNETKKSNENMNGTITYFRVLFEEDASLFEIAPYEKTMSQKVLHTVEAYHLVNQECLEDDERKDLEEQIKCLTSFVELEKKYPLENVFFILYANEVAKKCSEELDSMTKHKMSQEEFDMRYSKIKVALFHVWSNSSKAKKMEKEIEKDLFVPNNLRGIFDEIFAC